MKATKELADVETLYSRQGSCAHHVAEVCRRDGLKPAMLLGAEFYGVKVDQQMIDGVQGFIDYVADFPGDEYNEQKVYFTNWVPGGFGTMDAAKVSRERAHIIDLKYGEGVQVFAKENTQLMLYALGMYQMNGWLYDIQTFDLHVYQPRLDHVDVWQISLKDLLQWADEIVRPKAEEALAGTGKYLAGEHCQFCKIRKVCKARAQHMFNAITGELEDLDEQMTAPLPKVPTLTAEQVAKALSLKGQVTKWFSDVADYAEEQLRHGKQVGGWKLVEGRSNRVWKLDIDDVSDAISNAGLDDRKLWKPREFISPAQADEIYGKKLFAAATEKKAAGPLAYLVDKPRGSPVLASPDDKRPALTANPDEELDSLD
ncbi:MAG TPA: DUF2800 domain-containing protein [Steroidobacteraceae bacterium]|nr:DUF2800 domain-containing protein [Steroidobacteraceae bacterium]